MCTVHKGATRLDVPGERNKFGAPMFEPEVFRKQMCCVEESTGEIVGIFGAPPVNWRPIVIRRPGNCVPPTLRP